MKLTVDQALLKGNAHVRKGEVEQARKLFAAILQAFPENRRAQTALETLDRAMSVFPTKMKNPPKHDLDLLIALHGRGHFVDLLEQAEALLTDYPNSFVLWNILGVARKGVGRLEGAVTAFEQALAIKPDYADAHNNLGNALKDAGSLERAVLAFRRALALKPDYATAHNNLGTALRAKGDLDAAIASYERALAFEPAYADAHNNIGNALKDQGNLDEAITAYEAALRIRPNYADAYNNMGNALKDQGSLHAALAAYHRALEIRPDFATASNNKGNVLMAQGNLEGAVAAYRRALAVRPDYASAHFNMGNALKNQGILDDAIAAYERALKIQPDYPDAEAQILHQKQHICDWDGFAQLEEASARLGITTPSVPTFAMLSMSDNPQQQLARSRTWASERYRQVSDLIQARPVSRPSRLRVGYFGADFQDHATLYLLAGLLRRHDSARFDVHVYSYGMRKTGELRKRTEKEVDHFFDVSDQADMTIVAHAHEHHLDIAIDLNGYTTNSRSTLFQHRLAPVQVNYLGYPGSLGADFIDYIVGDPIVIPEDQRAHYSEKIIYLPHCYQPNDDTREIAETPTTRADHGLPEDAFVFCCFNNTYKISPLEFDIWMRVLTQVEGSVLWLMKSNAQSKANLCNEAERRGVDPSRLVFAEKLSHAEHLARHKHADLFIDTFHFNAHTTASDALWGGLPIVTCRGKQFAACVAASLLNAVGLTELIAKTRQEYEDLMLALARQPHRLAEIRQKLRRNRLKEPLFDTARYTRNFEQGLTLIYDRYFEGKSPQDVIVCEEGR